MLASSTAAQVPADSRRTRIARGPGQAIATVLHLDAVASRKINYTQWLKEVTKHALSQGLAYDNIAGFPVVEVAAKLDVSRQRVRQLIDEGVLDTIEVTTRAGTIALIIVTKASVDRYLADRVPDRNRQGYFAFP